MRLFAGVWPPPEVAHVIGSMARPDVPGVRWTTAQQWHVTLAFLGEVPDAGVEPLGAALVDAAARAAAPPEATLGPSTVVLGRAALCVPVGGLDEVALAVRAALGPLVPRLALDAHRYRGHVTLARASGRRTMPRRLAGAALEARWVVRELCLVRSETDPGGARYTTLASATVPS